MARGSLAVGVMTAVAAAFSWTMEVAETPRQEVALPPWLAGVDLRPTYTWSRLWTALLHGSEQRTDPPSPERKSLHAVAVRHPE